MKKQKQFVSNFFLFEIFSLSIALVENLGCKVKGLLISNDRRLRKEIFA